MNNQTLKTCPACGNAVSVRAPACPHCGEPFKMAATNPNGINMHDPVHVAGVIIAAVVGVGAIAAIVLTLFF